MAKLKRKEIWFIVPIEKRVGNFSPGKKTTEVGEVRNFVPARLAVVIYTSVCFAKTLIGRGIKLARVLMVRTCGLDWD